MAEMEKIGKSFVFVLLAGLVLGCSACSQLCRNIYEGVQLQKRQEPPLNIDAREQSGRSPGMTNICASGALTEPRPFRQRRMRRRKYPEKFGVRF